MAAIDELLPEWDVNEVHAVDLPCSPERALQAVLQLPVAPDPLVGLLFTLRGLAGIIHLARASHPVPSPTRPGDPDRRPAITPEERPGLGRGPTLGKAFRSMGFEMLAQSGQEIVAGAAGKPWRRTGGLRPFAEAGPGTVRMAIDFRAERTPAGCRLSTETRVQAVDSDALRLFRRYWRVVGPFSALIRRRWLAGLRRSLGP